MTPLTISNSTYCDAHIKLVLTNKPHTYIATALRSEFAIPHEIATLLVIYLSGCRSCLSAVVLNISVANMRLSHRTNFRSHIHTYINNNACVCALVVSLVA